MPKHPGGRPKEGNNDVRIVTRVSIDVAERITQLAAQENQSAAWVIRTLIDEALNRLQS